MANLQLTDSEIDKLKSKYMSELKVLQFQIQQVHTIINGLERARAGSGSYAINPAPVVSATLVEDSTSIINPPQRIRRTAPSGGYKLSIWDEIILEAISNGEKVMKTKELLAYAEIKLAADPEKPDTDEILGRLIRSLQKLANKRKMLVKHRMKGKGYGYGLTEWGTRKTIDPKYLD